MSPSSPVPKPLAATTGGPHDGPNPAQPTDPDLVDGPPIAEDEGGLEPPAGG
jgi:hypothetical protein